MTVAVEFKPVSMLDRIKTTKSNDGLLALAVEAIGYEHASDKTRRRWDRATQDRKVQLAHPEPESKPKPRAKTDRKGKRRGKSKDKS
ncbi:MAG: hypothetical protein DRJ03_19520 [Chloroflexi bacterium]|nr:MAG: hypothetical protein DRJ03_19520 [Chloroflexota bacterium]